MFKILLASVMLLSVVSEASAKSIPDYFKVFDGKPKGAFGSNMMQMRSKRLPYNTWIKLGRPGSIFQAAFRSDAAKQLLSEHNMYVANLFSTNYYELKAEFLLGDPNASNLSKTDTLSKLVATSERNPLVFARAKQMVANWNLEKLFVLKNPRSGLAHGFTARGIGGAEFEQKYGQLFVDFYVSQVSQNTDLLPLIKLADSSALFSSGNFTSLRAKATSLYETYRPGGSKGTYVTKSQFSRLKDIKDSVHNQLTPDIVNMIDSYMKNTKSSQGHQELKVIRALIKSYFGRGVVDIKHIAKKDNIPLGSLTKINVKSPKLADLAAYANELVQNRRNLISSVKLNKKYIHLGYSSVASSFLVDKIKVYISKNRINAKNIKPLTAVIFVSLYLQGFLNDDSFEIASQMTGDFDEYEFMYDDLLSEIIGRLKSVYSPYTEKWMQVDSHMDGIVDDSIRGSAINLLNDVLDKMD